MLICARPDWQTASLNMKHPVKGSCVECKQTVATGQARIRTSKGYMHKKCHYALKGDRVCLICNKAVTSACDRFTLSKGECVHAHCVESTIAAGRKGTINPDKTGPQNRAGNP